MRYLLAACCAVALLPAAQRYPATGLILKIDRPHKSFVASCKAIPQYMEAMVMPIPVHNEKLMDNLQAGVAVDFTLVVTGTTRGPRTSRFITSRARSRTRFKPAGCN
jgi:hypothetical protein